MNGSWLFGYAGGIAVGIAICEDSRLGFIVAASAVILATIVEEEWKWRRGN